MFHRGYGNITADANIISSFLAAMDAFASEFDKGAVKFTTTNYAFYYHPLQRASLVVAADRFDDEKTIRRSMEVIANTINISYHHILENWTGSLTEFEPLTPIVDAEFAQTNSWHKLLFQLRPDVNNATFSGPERRIISLLKFKGKATLGDIMKYMHLTRTEAERAARHLIKRKAVSVEGDLSSAFLNIGKVQEKRFERTYGHTVKPNISLNSY